MSDDELDRDWKPNGRPQSTMARSFSAALNDLFKIDNSLADLDAAVDQKKKAVSTQTSELQALEARLKATEERLKQRQSMIGISGRGSPSPRHRKPIGEAFTSPPEDGESQRSPTSPLAMEHRPKTPTRPPTGKRSVPSYTVPPMPGALPPTPGASEGDLNTLEDGEERISANYDIIHKDGDLPPPLPPSKSPNRRHS